MELMLASLAAQADSAATLPILWWLAPIGAAVALGTAFYLYRTMMEEAEGTPEMIEILLAFAKMEEKKIAKKYTSNFSYDNPPEATINLDKVNFDNY